MQRKGFLLSPAIILLILLISLLIYNGLLEIDSFSIKGTVSAPLIAKALFDYEFNKLAYSGNITNKGYAIAANSKSLDDFESKMSLLGVAKFEYLEDGINISMNYEYDKTYDYLNLSFKTELYKILKYPLLEFLNFTFDPETMSNCLNTHCYELDSYFDHCLEIYNEELVPIKALNSSVPIYVMGNVIVSFYLIHADFNMSYLFPYNYGAVSIPCQ